MSAVFQCADDIASLAIAARANESRYSEEDLDVFDSIFESAQTILLCSAHSKRLVDDVRQALEVDMLFHANMLQILTVSKLDSSLLAMTAVLINPIEIGHKVTRMFKAEATATDINLTCTVERSLVDVGANYFHGDPTRITQCLINLLTNALKFTKTSRGQKEVEVRIGATMNLPPEHAGVKWFPSGSDRKGGINLEGLGTGEAVYLVFLVRDTGKGMNADEMSKLFNRFSQANKLTHVE